MRTGMRGMILVSVMLTGIITVQAVDTAHEGSVDGRNNSFTLSLRKELQRDFRPTLQKALSMNPNLSSMVGKWSPNLIDALNSNVINLSGGTDDVQFQHGHPGGHRMVIRSMTSFSPFQWQDTYVELKDTDKIDFYFEGKTSGIFVDLPRKPNTQRGDVRIELVSMMGVYCGCTFGPGNTNALVPPAYVVPNHCAPALVPPCSPEHGPNPGSDATMWMITTTQRINLNNTSSTRKYFAYTDPVQIPSTGGGTQQVTYTDVRPKEIAIQHAGSSTAIGGSERCPSCCNRERIPLANTCSVFRICKNIEYKGSDGKMVAVPDCDLDNLEMLPCAPPGSTYSKKR